MELVEKYQIESSEEDLKDVQKALTQYFWERLQKRVDATVEEMGYAQEDFDA